MRPPITFPIDRSLSSVNEEEEVEQEDERGEEKSRSELTIVNMNLKRNSDNATNDSRKSDIPGCDVESELKFELR